jgi:hypothetical protein
MNNAHSIIIDYPIDYIKFPLAKSENIYKVELNKNEFLIIPKFWFHWVYTEPSTLSVNYEIAFVNFKEYNNLFYTSIYYNKPLKGVNINFDIKYDKFIDSSLNYNFRSIISDTSDCSPVIKNNIKKYYHNNSLKNIIEKNKDKYVYIGHNNIHENSLLNPISHINSLIDKQLYFNIYFKSTVWFTLDKIVNSGLHHDDTNNIIYVLDGKKTIYLLHPNSKPNIYIIDQKNI